jgi:predicted nucleotidyltransferase
VDKKAIAKEFADRLRADLGDRVESVRLFGSVARGDDLAGSDIDLLVLSKTSVFRELKGPIGHVLEMGAVPEVVSLTASEYDRIRKLNTPFYRTIQDEGIEI